MKTEKKNIAVMCAIIKFPISPRDLKLMLHLHVQMPFNKDRV